MAVEIRELVIRTTIENGDKKAMNNDKKKEDQGDLVSECVEQVMEILERQKGR